MCSRAFEKGFNSFQDIFVNGPFYDLCGKDNLFRCRQLCVEIVSFQMTARRYIFPKTNPNQVEGPPFAN